MTEWQRDLARTLVRLFDERYRLVYRGDAGERRRAEMRLFEVNSAMSHLLDDLAEGRERERFFVGINVPSTGPADQEPENPSERAEKS